MTMTPEVALNRVGRIIREMEATLDQLMKQGGRLMSEMVDAQEVLDLSYHDAQVAFMRVTAFLSTTTNGRKELIMAHGSMNKIAKTRSDIVWPSERIGTDLDNPDHEIAKIAA